MVNHRVMAAHTCYLWSLICENSFCDCSGRVKKRATKRDEAPKRQRIHDPSSSSESEDEEYVPPSHTPVDDPFEDYEDEGEDDVLINERANIAPRVWTAADYSSERHPYQYGLERNTSNLYFYTEVQEEAFFGHLVNKTVFAHQTIDLNYMSSQLVMRDLIPMLQHIGLREFLTHRCDWNNTIIRQFYATVELNFADERIEWMTGKIKYEASFADFAKAIKINYQFTIGPNIISLQDDPEMRDDDITGYYEPNRTGIDCFYGRITGLKHWPAVLSKISRCTLVPKSGYRENFLGYSRNFVDHVLRGEKMDVVRTIMHQIQFKKKNLEVNIYFAPYIMSFIIQETNFYGPRPEKHTPYKPFSNDRDFLHRALTPINEVDDPHAPFNPNAGQEAPAQESA
jgi:hypothetical protein